MVPVSHAADLKASNPKTSNQALGSQQPAKTGFQALIDRLARTAHAETGEKPAKVTQGKPGAEAVHHERKPEKVAADKADKLEKSAAEKTEKRDDANPLMLAALVLKPEPVRNAEAQALQASLVKAVRERAEAKPAVPAVTDTAQPGPRLVPAKHAEQAADEKPKVTVLDKRSEKEKEKAKTEAAQSAAQLQSLTAPLPAPETAAKSDAVTGVAESKVVFHPTDQGTPFDIKPQNAPVAPRDAASFQQYLVDKGYGQLVEQARIVLKDNNAGEIRMTLHPESLGKVKVALNLSDGSLAGQIFVENQTVKDVFQANLDGLLQAFRDGGWSNLSLQVSVGGDQKRQNPDAAPVPARDYGRQVAEVSAEAPETLRIGAWTDRQINLTA